MRLLLLPPLLLLTLWPALRAAQTPLLAEGGASGDEFALSLAQQGSWLALGSPGANDGRGAVRLFQCAGEQCTATQSLAPAELLPGQAFGTAVALSPNWLAVSAPTAQGGAVWLYQRSGDSFSLQQRIDATPGDGDFGRALALGDTQLFVAAPAADAERGVVVAYIRQGDSWVNQTRLLSTLPAAGARYGQALALDGGPARLAVGAPGASDGQPGSHGQGTVELRQASAPFTLQASVDAPGRPQGARFGYAVALDGDRLLVGAPKAAAGTGLAHVYARNGASWSWQAALGDANALPADRQGWAVALAGGQALIGAPFALAGCGQVLLAQETAGLWSAVPLSLPPLPAQLAGYALALSAERSVIGVPGHNGAASHRGAAFVLDLIERIHGNDFEATAAQRCMPANG